MVKPEYPRLARRLGKEGKVVFRLFIDAHGRLLNVEVVKKAGHGFDEAVIEAVKASSFQPARLNGKPVDCKATLPISFKLQ
jgi:protein TonB